MEITPVKFMTSNDVDTVIQPWRGNLACVNRFETNRRGNIVNNYRRAMRDACQHRVLSYVHSAVTEYEITRGMLAADCGDCNSTSLCFMRHIHNLERNLSHTRTRQYLDLLPADPGPDGGGARSPPTVDQEAQSLLAALRDKVCRVLTDGRCVEYLELDWNQDRDCNPSDDEQYIGKIVVPTRTILTATPAVWFIAIVSN